MPHPPPAEIADLAFLSDCHTAALIDRGGTVCWWCPPRFDAGSVCGCLLGAESGHWSLRPVEPHEVTRAYEPGTLVLRTSFTTASGKVDVLDALALTSGARGEEHGLNSPRRCCVTSRGSRARSSSRPRRLSADGRPPFVRPSALTS